MKINLREIRESDLPFLNKARNKYSVSKYLNLFQPKNLESERQWFLATKGEIHFAIVVDSDFIVGQVSLIHFSNDRKIAEFTIFLDDVFWGKGYGKIATKVMLHYAFNELALHKVFLHVYDGNDSAKALYESVGFVCEGKIRDFVFKAGKYLDAYLFGIFAHEFLMSKNTEGIISPLLFDNAKGKKG